MKCGKRGLSLVLLDSRFIKIALIHYMCYHSITLVGIENFIRALPQCDAIVGSVLVRLKYSTMKAGFNDTGAIYLKNLHNSYL